MVWRAGVGLEVMDVLVAARKRWPANLGASAILLLFFGLGGVVLLRLIWFFKGW